MALTITQANVAKSSAGASSSGVAGATITAGQLLYIDTAAYNVLKPTVATSATGSVVAGIAEHGALLGQPIRYCTSDSAFTIGCTGTIGDTVWAYSTAGQMTITQAEGVATSTYTTAIGVYISTTQIRLNLTPAGAVR